MIAKEVINEWQQRRKESLESARNDANHGNYAKAIESIVSVLLNEN